MRSPTSTRVAPGPSAADKPILADFAIEANQGYTAFEGPQAYRAFPVRFCLPVAAGISRPEEGLALTDAAGTPRPVHASPLLLWPDGSVRVWEVSLPLDLARGGTSGFSLRRGKAQASQAVELLPLTPLPPAQCTITLTLPDGRAVDTTVKLTNPAGKAGGHVLTEDEFSLGDGGSAVELSGAIVRRQWSFFSGSEWEVRLTNLGGDDSTPLEIAGLTLWFDLPSRGQPRYTVRQTAFTAWGHPRLIQRDNPLSVRAHGSVHVTDAAQLGEDENRYPPYERGGYVCTVSPWLAAGDDKAAWLLIMPDAVERGPKGWTIDAGKVTIDLHLRDADPLRWRQGMTLYQRLVLQQLPAGTPAEELENAAQAWLRPPLVGLGADVFRQAGWRIPFRYEPVRFPRTEFHFRDSFNFTWNHGTFDYGDQIAGTKGGGPMSPGQPGLARNLEYDFPAVAAKEFARTGVTHLLRLCQASAQHMMDTDFVARSSDPWKEGGIVHHCPEHTTGAAYPSHMWAEGLTLYHQLTGDRHALRVACRVGDFYLKHIRERFAVVQSTAREVGWTLIALAAIYDLTREPRYLEGIACVVDHNLDAGRAAFFPTDACFTIGVAIIGFDRARHYHRDADTQRFILELLDWMMADRRDDIGLFEYWRDPELGAIPYIQAHLPEALNIGYLLSGDERYLRAAFRLYQIHQGGGLLTVQNRISPPECGFAAGNHITWMGCLGSFAEKGWLDGMQYPEPG